MRPTVHGLDVDSQTRCRHWHSPVDIVAIRMHCCGEYYACKDCHAALADHAPQVWPREAWQSPAVLCGACGTELTVQQYLDCHATCPACGAGFNPRCSLHSADYFAVAAAAGETSPRDSASTIPQV